MKLKGSLYLATYIIFGGLSVYGSSQNGDSLLNLKQERESLVSSNVRHYYLSGSATVHFAEETSLSTAVMTADIDRSDVAVMAQNGTGHYEYRLSAESYYKLSSVSTVWGHAGYGNGKTLDIAISDVIDYEAVAPYVLCDDTGGNINNQTYDIGGGWNRVYGDKWALGAQANYRATMAHRAVDPRVRNIVSDLNIEIGGAKSLAQSYLIGLNLGIRVYHQDTDVDFYNTLTHAITMIYTGLGSTSSRFRGADAQTSSHRMVGFSASLQMVPKSQKDRFFTSVSAKMSNMDFILNGYNNLKFGLTSTLSIQGQHSQLYTVGRNIILLPTIAAYISNRTATENLFGASAENYTKIGERQNYHHRRYGVICEVPLTAKIGSKSSVSVMPRVGYASDKESLVEPRRQVCADYIIGAFSLAASKRLGHHWSIGGTIDYAERFVTSTSAEWGGLDLSSPIGVACLSNYNMMSCRMVSERIELSASRSFRALVLSLSASLQHFRYKSLSDANRLFVGLSMTF